jgi:hypothetical protein
VTGLSQSRPIFCGDAFVAALSLVLAMVQVKSAPTNRVYVAGHTPYIFEILDILCRWQRPVIWSSLFPRQGEADLARMLYERGTPAALTEYNPESWRKGDLVLLFSVPPGLTIRSGAARVIDLTEQAAGRLPRWEAVLAAQGVDSRLGFLCPIMEAFLSPKEVSSGRPRDNILEILRAGYELDVWDLFLDNRDGGLYNTIKGSV